MKFTIGANVYTVHLCTGALKSDDRPAVGLTLWDSRRILLSGLLPTDRRLDVLLHEIAEAWNFEVGEPGRKESRYDWYACVTRCFMRDFSAAGGEAALLNLRPTVDAKFDNEPKRKAARQ